MPRPGAAAGRAAAAGLLGCLIAPLVIGDPVQRPLPPARLPQGLQPDAAELLQTVAHLLQRHLRVFPPATARCDRPRRSASAGTTPDAGATPHSSALHNGSSPTHFCPPAVHAPRSTAETR